MTKLLTPIVVILALLLACTPAQAGYTQTNVQPSVYKLEAYVDGIPAWSGTGTKVAEDLVLTAGHVCDGADSLRAVNLRGQSYPTYVLKTSTEAERELGLAPDICLLYAPAIPGESIPMFLGPVERYTDIFVVGAPLGIYGNGVAPSIRGQYIGGDMCVAEGAPGYSGSLVMTTDGAIGVLYAGYPGISLFYMVTVPEIFAYLASE